MIGITEQTQNAGAMDVVNGADRHAHAVEVRRVLDVSGVFTPGIAGHPVMQFDSNANRL